MTQAERRTYLIRELLAEQPRYRELSVPADAAEQKQLLRSLMNVRAPGPVSEEFLSDIQVIFNVFKDIDDKIYKNLLTAD